jgi:hypothetical protein
MPKGNLIDLTIRGTDGNLEATPFLGRASAQRREDKNTMWLFTDNGFVSAIRYDNNKDDITVRARDKKSLAELIERTGAKIISRKDTDYPYRVIISDGDWASWVADKALNIDYPNFKNRVYQTRGRDFAHLLSEVWGVMLGAEKLELEATTGKKISNRDFYERQR